MAAPISHIVYAKRYFEKNPSTINKDEFILGCLFPDIRRVSENIKRKDTHIPEEILENVTSIKKRNSIDLDFTGLTSFQAGWKFHLYCDMKREEILKNKLPTQIIKKINTDFGGYRISDVKRISEGNSVIYTLELKRFNEE